MAYPRVKSDPSHLCDVTRRMYRAELRRVDGALAIGVLESRPCRVVSTGTTFVYNGRRVIGTSADAHRFTATGAIAFCLEHGHKYPRGLEVIGARDLLLRERALAMRFLDFTEELLVELTQCGWACEDNVTWGCSPSCPPVVGQCAPVGGE